MPDALLLLRALTSLHAGAGSSTGGIDLPIQRERHTGWPTMQGSAVKGVLRDAYRDYLVTEREADLPVIKSDKPPTNRDRANLHDEVKAIFGPEDTGEGGHAGALAVTDARILAFPVRSAKGLFAWIACPALIERLHRDLGIAQLTDGAITAISLGEEDAVVSEDGMNLLGVDDTKLVLEDLCLTRKKKVEVDTTLAKLVKSAAGNGLSPDKRIIVVSDDAFTYLVRNATEVTTRIRLNYETKRVETGALFVQEFLPPETLIYSLLLARDARGIKHVNASDVHEHLKRALKDKPLQFGGEETTGKGICGVTVYGGPGQ